MVPIPLPPADCKVNSVLSCFFLPQVNSSMTWRFKPCQQKWKCTWILSVIHPALSYEVKPLESPLLETVTHDDACCKCWRRGSGLYVLSHALFTQDIYSLDVRPVPVQSYDLSKQWTLVFNQLRSCHSLVHKKDDDHWRKWCPSSKFWLCALERI